jgi:predicted metal-dependent phosphotriesterase family hydrolase
MRVETVRGAMAVDGLGTTLMHEHVRAVGRLQDPPVHRGLRRAVATHPGGKLLKAQLRKNVEWGAQL